MTIYEFDQARHERAIREDARNEGREEGRREGREEGRKEGRREGREKGRNEILEALVQKKLAKGKTVPEIADDLEETAETVERIIKAIGR